MTFPTRTLQELHAVAEFMRGFPGQWWLGGGWSIDASLGIPATTPELVLLHKAWTVRRAKDDHDFQHYYRHLSDQQRAWLLHHMTRTRPDHRWLPLLQS